MPDMMRRCLGGLALLLAWPAWAQSPSPSALVPLMGTQLIGPGGEKLGRVVDVVADLEARPVAAVVDVGGFMGLGSRRVAVAWHVLRLRAGDGVVRLTIDVAPDVVIAAPEFRPDEPATIFDPSPRK